jgi:hypothetical protein
VFRIAPKISLGDSGPGISRKRAIMIENPYNDAKNNINSVTYLRRWVSGRFAEWGKKKEFIVRLPHMACGF